MNKTRRGERLAETVFGEEWKKCTNPLGRQKLRERVEDGELIVYGPVEQWAEQDTPPAGIKTHQIQYQLLAAQLSAASPFESGADAPDDVVEAVGHINAAMTLVGDGEER